MFNDIALFSHRTPAMKALNATGQQNINFDTLFQVFILNSVMWHVDFHLKLFQSRSGYVVVSDFKAMQGRHGEKDVPRSHLWRV